MRWPLRNQILLRTFLLLLVTLSAVTLILIRSRIQFSRAAEVQKLEKISDMLTSFPFPKSDSVLEAMKSLSGAEFSVSTSGDVVARTQEAPLLDTDSVRLNSNSAIRVSGLTGNWYVKRLNDVSYPGTRSSSISVYLPIESDREILWRVGLAPLLTTAIVLPFAMLLGLLFSNQITKPIGQLCESADVLSRGDPVNLPAAKRNDEIGDLLATMNSMAAEISENQKRLARGERMAALVEVGNGVAHNLRNSAAGCQMALQLMASNQKEIGASEEYRVAMRQLELMNSYIKRFLALSRQQTASANPRLANTDLHLVVEESIDLLGPMARHLSVELVVTSCEPCSAIIGRDDALQVMLNLITNAIHAAKNRALVESNSVQPLVRVSLALCDGGAVFSVSDNGSGPADDIAANIFEPFVSGSSEGVGLGLPLVMGIADKTGGRVSWKREASLTTFTFHFQIA